MITVIKEGKTAPVEAVQLEFPEKDQIVEICYRIENVDPNDVIKELHQLCDASNCDNFQLGGYLLRVKNEDLWKQVGSASFDDYLEENLGFRRSKAEYLIKIYDRLVEADIPWKKVRALGWTKLRYLSRILKKSNADYWAEKAKGMTVRQIKEAVSNELALSDDDEGESKSLSKLSFTVFQDEKETIELAIDQAKRDTGWKRDGNALEGICMNYLSSGGLKAVQCKTGDVKIDEE